MRKMSMAVVAFAVVAALISGCSSSKPPRYGIKSGTIKYEINPGQGLTLEQTLYFEDFGRKEAVVTNSMSVMGTDTVYRHTLSITTPQYIYSIDMDSKSGVRLYNDPAKMVKKMLEVIDKSDLSDEQKQQLSNIVEQQKESFNTEMPLIKEIKKLEPVRTDTFMGKECEVYKVNETLNAEVYMWKSIPLKIVDATGNVLQKAIEINTDPVQPGVFEVPEEIEIQDYIERFAESLKRQTG